MDINRAWKPQKTLTFLWVSLVKCYFKAVIKELINLDGREKNENQFFATKILK